jgi:hypothetical protein
MSDAHVLQSLYGTPPVPSSTALTNTAPRGDTASKLCGDGKPAAPVPASRDPAALRLAQAMRGGRGVEPEEDDAPVPAAKPAGDEQDDEQTDDIKDEDDGEGNDEPPLTDDGRLNYAQVMRDVADVSVQRLGMSTEDAAANAEATAASFEAFGIGATEAASLTEYAVGIVTREVSDAQRMQWRRDARDVIAQEVGPENVDRAIAQAQALVRRHPSTRQWLARTGAGDHPAFVRAVINVAWRQR